MKKSKLLRLLQHADSQVYARCTFEAVMPARALQKRLDF